MMRRLLSGITDVLKIQLRQSPYLQVDETPVRCQDPDVPGKTVQGWLWVISRPGGDVVFEWRMSRRHDEVSTLLAGFQGLLQSDGYEAYARFVAQREGLVHLGCWAHARRHFHEALADAPVRAGFILRLIGQRGLLGDDGPVRHPAKRRRLKTVIQELIYRAGRLIAKGRRLTLGLGANDRAAKAFARVHGELFAARA